MPTIEEQLDKLKPDLKRIAAGRGVTGNFFFAMVGKNVHLGVTLARRDPRGKKVVKETRDAVKNEDEFKGFKFVHGKLVTEIKTGKKLIFDMHALEGVGTRGKLPATEFRKGIKLFAKEYKNKGLSFLRTAILRDGKEVDAAQDEEPLTAGEAEDLQLDAKDEAELEDILKDQAALALANNSLSESGKLDELTAEQTAEIEDLLADIMAMAKATPRDETQLKAERRKLAELLGPEETFPGEGELVPQSIQVLLDTANDAMVSMLLDLLEKATTEITTVHDDVDTKKEDEEALGDIADAYLSSLSTNDHAVANILAQLKAIPIPDK